MNKSKTAKVIYAVANLDAALKWADATGINKILPKNLSGGEARICTSGWWRNRPGFVQKLTPPSLNPVQMVASLSRFLDVDDGPPLVERVCIGRDHPAEACTYPFTPYKVTGPDSEASRCSKPTLQRNGLLLIGPEARQPARRFPLSCPPS
ncbi:hypothetical protein EVAR_12417_1 [Eumeta japonica]|uniref:Uncharacterized protein n=1 Tax=Eumeta variegata TaxID=151549 RepID=A0A4C1U0N1_EUMVA|nr:hypothetical protein EVAR_12417_1 [Eumeta japonica]